MSISLSSSFMVYARSMEGKSLEGFSRLSPFVFQSKVTKDSTSNKSDIVATSNVKETTVTAGREVFFGNNLSKSKSNVFYVIDGVTFSSDEVNAIRSVLQNAVSPLSGGKLYYDYKDYAAMGIAESTVAEYAKENLTEEQAEVVNKCLSDYIGNLLDKQSEWIDSECHFDDTEGVGDTGELNTYYGVRHNVEQWMLDEMRDYVLNNMNLPQDSKNILLANIDATGRTGGIISCASNKDLAGNIRSLFAGIDVTDANQLAEAFKQYKNMMNAVYAAAGFGRTTNNILSDDTNSFIKQVSNMRAVIAGVGATRVDSVV